MVDSADGGQQRRHHLQVETAGVDTAALDLLGLAHPVVDGVGVNIEACPGAATAPVLLEVHRKRLGGAPGDLVVGRQRAQDVHTAICPGIINSAITTSSRYRAGDEDARRAKTSAAYAKRGYTAQRAATNILRAIERGEAVGPITPEAHVMYVLSRVAPPVARWMSAKLAEVAK